MKARQIYQNFKGAWETGRWLDRYREKRTVRYSKVPLDDGYGCGTPDVKGQQCIQAVGEDTQNQRGCA